MSDETRTLEDMDMPCPLDICDGSGEIPTDEYDDDSKQYMKGVGTQKCLCKTDRERDTDY